jgi:repressor LexA
VGILERQGLLNHEPGISRGLTPAQSPQPVGLRIRGRIAAGDPLDLFDAEEAELLEFDELASALTPVPTRTEKDIYALQVRGTSMIGEGILNGDYVLIAPSPTVASGALAVVIDNNANGGRGAATLKRVYIGQNSVRLQPANPRFKSRIIAAQEWDREWHVQGTVLAIYRPYVPERTVPHR